MTETHHKLESSWRREVLLYVQLHHITFTVEYETPRKPGTAPLLSDVVLRTQRTPGENQVVRLDTDLLLSIINVRYT